MSSEGTTNTGTAADSTTRPTGGSAGAPAAKPTAAVPPPPDPALLALRDELQKVLGPEAVWECSGKLPAFRVPREKLHSAAARLRDAGYDYCLFVTAVDFIKENRFEMVYALTRYRGGGEIALVTDLVREEAEVSTVSDLWPTAEWHEREVYDLFGIRFQGHQDLRRILLDDTWTGHPLRKDYTDTAHEMIKRPY